MMLIKYIPSGMNTVEIYSGNYIYLYHKIVGPFYWLEKYWYEDYP